MIAVIGAGVSGCYVAYLLAKAGFSVRIFEEHREIGKPVQCTGLVSASIEKLDPIFKSSEFSYSAVLRRHSRITLRSGKTEIDLNLRKPDYLLDRAAFDRFLAKLAKVEGAKLELNSKLVGISERKDSVQLTLRQRGITKKVACDAVIGCDGPLSLVARHLGFERRFAFAFQHEGILKVQKSDILVTLESCHDGGWVVPVKGKLARVGVGFLGKPNPAVFESFSRCFLSAVLGIQSGLIPVWDNKPCSRGRFYLVGDAACQVKATTFGGIVPALKGAQALARAFCKSSGYESELTGLRRELNLNLAIRNFLASLLREKTYAELLEIANSRFKTLLESVSRDECSGVLGRLPFLSSPRAASLVNPVTSLQLFRLLTLPFGRKNS